MLRLFILPPLTTCILLIGSRYLGTGEDMLITDYNNGSNIVLVVNMCMYVCMCVCLLWQ